MTNQIINETVINAMIAELKQSYKTVLVEFDLGIDSGTRSFQSNPVALEEPKMQIHTILDPETFEVQETEIYGNRAMSYIVRGNVIDEDTFSIRQIVSGGIIIQPA